MRASAQVGVVQEPRRSLAEWRTTLLDRLFCAGSGAIATATVADGHSYTLAILGGSDLSRLPDAAYTSGAGGGTIGDN